MPFTARTYAMLAPGVQCTAVNCRPSARETDRQTDREREKERDGGGGEKIERAREYAYESGCAITRGFPRARARAREGERETTTAQGGGRGGWRVCCRLGRTLIERKRRGGSVPLPLAGPGRRPPLTSIVNQAPLYVARLIDSPRVRARRRGTRCPLPLPPGERGTYVDFITIWQSSFAAKMALFLRRRRGKPVRPLIESR